MDFLNEFSELDKKHAAEWSDMIKKFEGIDDENATVISFNGSVVNFYKNNVKVNKVFEDEEHKKSHKKKKCKPVYIREINFCNNKAATKLKIKKKLNLVHFNQILENM